MHTNVLNDNRLKVYTSLMAYSQGNNNDDALACMLASWQSARSILPDYMGMEPDKYYQMLEFHFPGFDGSRLPQPKISFDPSRQDELHEVQKLLVSQRADRSETELWLACIIAVACQAQDHLWQDLGLWSRNDLSELLARNFPTLATMNDRNMKWKKFIYKQLCIAEGIYTCRAPSCDACADYEKCFGPED